MMPAPHPTLAKPAATTQGFTLIELMVVLALVGVLFTLAAPSFLQFQRNSKLRTVSASLVSALSAARSEALKRQKYTFVQPINGDWNNGWIAYVDMNSNLVYDAATDIVLAKQSDTDAPTSLGVTINSTLPTAYVMFSGSGFPRTTAGAFAAGALILAIDGSADTKRSIVLAPTGRVRVCDPAQATDCPSTTQ